MRYFCFARVLYKTGDSQLSHPFRYAMSFAGPLDRHIRLLRQEAAFTKRIPAERVCGGAMCICFYSAGVTAVMCGFTPSYQYRKPSMSILSPIFSALTAAYTSVVLSQRYDSTVKV